MSRRSTPERLDAARRAATLARLISAGLLPERAESALTAWAARKSQEGRPLTPADWEAAYQENSARPDTAAGRGPSR